MKMISYIIPLLITLGGTLISINALNSKTNLEEYLIDSSVFHKV